MSTTVNTMDLGVTVCRAIMRDLDDKPILLDLPSDPPSLGGSIFERTSACGLADQWTVKLIPTLDFVTVTANGWLFGSGAMGFYEQLDIGGEKRPEYHYVTYPDDPAEITGEAYVGKLRGVVERALAKVEEARP